jgi:hypothetical protein
LRSERGCRGSRSSEHPQDLRDCVDGKVDVLSRTRGVGEVANLLLLFASDSSQLANWRHAARRERMERFSPMGVRLTLEKLGVTSPIDQARYKALSEGGVHATPETVPQAHNPRGRAVLGQVFQLPGAIAALTELAAATVLGVHSSARLLDLPPAVRTDFDRRAGAFIDGLPAIDVMNVKELLASLGKADSGGSTDRRR